MKQPTLKICPATNGLPTRMSKSTWEKVCAGHQRREHSNLRMHGAEILNYCRVCQGKKKPKELKIVRAW
jgi:hypothetical protein